MGFKKRILEFLDNPKNAKKVIKNNLKKAENYKWDNIAKATLKVYKKEISNKTKH
jgi:glycosyltransferase involved in cell wall biosynthesis